MTGILCVAWAVLCTEMHSLDQDGQELGDPPASTTGVLSIKGLDHHSLLKLELYLSFYTKINSKWIEDFSATQAVKT